MSAELLPFEYGDLYGRVLWVLFSYHSFLHPGVGSK